jgi:hypothetical protein
MLNDGGYSTVSTPSSSSSQPNAAKRKIEVIVNHQNLLEGKTKIPQHLQDGFAAQVHERLGFKKHNTAPFNIPHSPNRSKPVCPPFDIGFPGQQIENLKPHVVAGRLIPLPGISQSYHDSDAFFAIGLTTHLSSAFERIFYNSRA